MMMMSCWLQNALWALNKQKSAVGISQCRMATSDSNGRFGIEEETVSGF